ncbi:TIGR03618 family F420-dependent PPOX class oxidoreductase [Actinomycetospora lemnae]|jgi:PPOX class probable F420-dependent enzyme|uniref:TIGR03618 family F420-dependent PPOX class oxidoreductase n=1 Tax=Actinomycetospora lemnae TaxID=3019891 RepID=A0ABT5SXG9_9PSEU|nr:TIGR03618 family F420-dependent PPOX class oxidoreductase [Actinomycetospora sp. DW7H6]MDD7967557.1 TIGR03618 family F420-dependent PPOX class oxidoreductase [Actinomycetospora sp. DW7H6]
MDLDDFRERAAGEQFLVVVSTARADGSIQSSVVNAGVMDHPVHGTPVLALVAAGGSVKLANLRARPWTTITVRSGWRWTTVEGAAEIAGPDDPLAGVDDVPALLREVFVAAGGQHDDWVEYDETMARERRAAVLVTPSRVYGV